MKSASDVDQWMKMSVFFSGQLFVEVIEMIHWSITRFREKGVGGGFLGTEHSRCCQSMGAYLCTLLTQWEHFNLIPLFL